MPEKHDNETSERPVDPHAPAAPDGEREALPDDKVRPRLSTRKRWLFRLIAFSLPIIPLLIAEGVLRFQGYGGYPPVLRELGSYGGETYYGTNQPGLSTFFFQNKTTPGSMNEQVFTMPKGNRLRVAVLGGSAARGFPEPPNLAAASFLEAMLQDLTPGREVEVLNFGTTALASFPQMYIAREVLQFDPDLIIVYSGNNEFYGAHGVASVHSFGQSTFAMKAFRAARWTAVGQWITDIETRESDEQRRQEAGKTLMARVIDKSLVGYDDPMRRHAAQNIRNHIRDIIRQCKSAGVPVLVSTVPCNERDIAPIGDDVKPGVPDDKVETFRKLLTEGRNLSGTAPAAGLAKLDEATSIWARNAMLHYYRGRGLQALGRYEEAREAFFRAVDLDTMPWRAPSSINDGIRAVAGEEGVECADLESVFRANSTGGSIGWSLMDDHVHPSLRGQDLIARSWLRSMAEMAEPVEVSAGDIDALADFETYATRLGANRFDTYGVANRMYHLIGSEFYRKNNPAAFERYRDICVALEQQMSEPVLDAVSRWQNPKVHIGGHRPITGMVGMAMISEQRYAEANEMLTIATHSVPRYSIWNARFGWQALKCRRLLRDQPLPEDIAFADWIIRNGETFMGVTDLRPPQVMVYVGLTCNAVNRHHKAVALLGEAIKLQAVQDQDGVEVLQALVQSLVRTNQQGKAMKLLSMPVRDPRLRQASLELQAALKAGRL